MGGMDGKEGCMDGKKGGWNKRRNLRRKDWRIVR